MALSSSLSTVDILRVVAAFHERERDIGVDKGDLEHVLRAIEHTRPRAYSPLESRLRDREHGNNDDVVLDDPSDDDDGALTERDLVERIIRTAIACKPETRLIILRALFSRGFVIASNSILASLVVMHGSDDVIVELLSHIDKSEVAGLVGVRLFEEIIRHGHTSTFNLLQRRGLIRALVTPGAIAAAASVPTYETVLPVLVRTMRQIDSAWDFDDVFRSLPATRVNGRARELARNVVSRTKALS